MRKVNLNTQPQKFIETPKPANQISDNQVTEVRKAEEKILEEVEPVEPKLGKVDEKIENIGAKEAVVANKVEQNKSTFEEEE